MRFKNLFVYRLESDWNISAANLEHMLASHALQPCSSFEMESRGWLPPQQEGQYLYTQARHWLVTLGIDQKLLPASVIRQVVVERAAVQEKKQGHSVGRKQLREIKERVVDELMPRALTRRQSTSAWIDAPNGWFVVDTVTQTKAARLLEMLHKTGAAAPARLLETQRSPSAAMTDWIANGEVSPDFTIDQDLELRAGDAGKAIVRYVRHGLEGKDIQAHIAAGKTVTRLGLTWKDKISFILTEALQIKRLAYLNLLDREPGQSAENKEEQFDLDFALMTGELALFLTDLVALLGGEKPVAA